MKTIFFVRHGLSDANVAGITSGGDHEAILTEEGRNQATHAGKDLKSKKIDMIVCSPMKRTIETAQLIAKELGIDEEDIVPNGDFIERLMGYYSGRPHTEYRADMQAGTPHETLETPAQLHARVKRGLDALRELPANKIVLVSHGATGRMIKLISEGMHHDDMYKIDAFGNTEIYEFTLD